jgi:hypothetical protein
MSSVANDRDWALELLTLTADLIDRDGRASFGPDEAWAIREILARLDLAEGSIDDWASSPVPPLAASTSPKAERFWRWLGGR